jgi:hypothetical protein
LGGWALTLLAGVSFTVVPMFQMTPPYPAWLRRSMPATLGVALAVAAVAVLALRQSGMFVLALVPAVLSAMAFALVTMWLQRRRRRASSEATGSFFRAAMLALIAAGLLWLASSCLPRLAAMPWIPAGIGVLCLVGVFVSAISGMLYKIVPFISWLKLPPRSGSSAVAPNIKMFISERAAVAQMRLHFAALAMLLACLAMPQLTRAAGLAFAASCAWLGANLARGIRVYVKLGGRFSSEG